MKNAELLGGFTGYCLAHPDERFWQALRNWSGAIQIAYDGHDTFYCEKKTPLGDPGLSRKSKPDTAGS
jgi:hypothetical protein